VPCILPKLLRICTPSCISRFVHTKGDLPEIDTKATPRDQIDMREHQEGGNDGICCLLGHSAGVVTDGSSARGRSGTQVVEARDAGSNSRHKDGFLLSARLRFDGAHVFSLPFTHTTTTETAGVSTAAWLNTEQPQLV